MNNKIKYKIKALNDRLDDYELDWLNLESKLIIEEDIYKRIKELNQILNEKSKINNL